MEGRRVGRAGRDGGVANGVVAEGSAAIWLVTLMSVIWVAAGTVMVAGGVRAARHRAHAAADDAALAAASHAGEGAGGACGIALDVARASGAELVSCRLVGEGELAGYRPSADSASGGLIAEVSVEVTFRGPASIGTLRVPAQARAGPVIQRKATGGG